MRVHRRAVRQVKALSEEVDSLLVRRCCCLEQIIDTTRIVKKHFRCEKALLTQNNPHGT